MSDVVGNPFMMDPSAYVPSPGAAPQGAVTGPPPGMAVAPWQAPRPIPVPAGAVPTPGVGRPDFVTTAPSVQPANMSDDAAEAMRKAGMMDVGSEYAHTYQDTSPNAQGQWSDVARATGQRLVGAAEALYGTLADSPEARQNAVIAAQNAQAYEANAARQGMPQGLSDIHGVGDLGKIIGKGLIEGAGNIAPIVGGGLVAGIPGMVAGVAADALVHSGTNLMDQGAAGQAMDVTSALGYSIPQSLLDVGTAEMTGGSGIGASMLKAISGGARAGEAAAAGGANWLMRMGAGAAGEAVEQAGVGAGQAALQDLATNRDVTSHDVLEGAILGGMAGIPFGAARGFHASTAKPPIPEVEPTNLLQDQAGTVLQLKAPEAVPQLPAPAERGAAPQLPAPAEVPRLPAPLGYGQPMVGPPPELVGPHPYAPQPQTMMPAANVPRTPPAGADQAAIQSLQGITDTRGLPPPPAGGAAPGGPASPVARGPASPMGGPATLPIARPGEVPPLVGPTRPIEVPPSSAGGGPRPAAPTPTVPAMPPRAQAALDRAAASAAADRAAAARQSAAAALAQPPVIERTPVPGGRTPEEAARMQVAAAPIVDTMRQAWADHNNGSGAGFVQAMGSVLQQARGDADRAAQLIRDKASSRTSVSYDRLDAMHQALTGETMEQHAQGLAGPPSPATSARQLRVDYAATDNPATRDALNAAHQQITGQGIDDFNAARREAHATGTAEAPDTAASVRQLRVDYASTEDPAAREALNRAHEALTGQSIEDFNAARRAAHEGEGNAPEVRQQQADNLGEHLGDGEGGAPAEGGGGGEPVERAANRPEAVQAAEGVGQPVRPPAEEAAPRPVSAISRWMQTARGATSGLKAVLDRIEQAFHDNIRRTDTGWRQPLVNQLSHIALLERGRYADRARELLDDLTTLHEQRVGRADAERLAGERLAAQGTNLEPGPLERRGVADQPAAPHDAALAAMAEHGVSLRDALQHVADTHPDEDIRNLAQHFLDHGVEGHVRMATDAERAAAPADALGHQAGDTVALHSPFEAGQTLVHEAAHMATRDALDAGGRNAVAMRQLYADAQKIPGLRGYGMQDVHEFVAEAFSNPQFREALRSARGTLWERFKNTVARMLGFGNDANLLDKVMRTAGDLMNDRLDAATRDTDGSPAAVYRQASEGGAPGWTHGASDMGQRFWKDWVKDKASWLNLHSMQTNLIVRRMEGLVPSIRDLWNTMQARTERISELRERAVDMSARLDAVRRESGREGIKRFNDMVGLTQSAGRNLAGMDRGEAQQALREAQAEMNRHPANSGSDAALEAKEALRQARAAAEGTQLWAKLTTAEKDAVTSAFTHLKEMQDVRYNAIRNMLGDEAARRLAHPDTSKPYAPLKRYGDWIVSAKSAAYQEAERQLERARGLGDEDGINNAARRLELMMKDADHRSVHAVDNQREAAELAGRLQGVLGDGAQVTHFLREEFHQQKTGYRDAFVDHVLGRLDQRFGDTPDVDRIKQMIRDTYIEQLPDGSQASLQAHRQLVSGWHDDFGRAVVERLGRDAFQIGTAEHGLALAENARALRDQVRNLPAGTTNDERVRANEAARVMGERMVHQTDYRNYSKAEKWIAEGSHIFYLGASPSFLMMNMLQMPMITAPLMAARFGFSRSWGALSQALREMHGMTSFREGLTPEAIAKSSLSADEKAALIRAQRLGLIDVTAAHMSAQEARGEHIFNPQTPAEHAQFAAQKGKEMLRMPIQWTETMNRASTMLAAYRLAREGGIPGRGGVRMDHEQAVQYAADVVRDSHVDYSAQNNPTIYRAPAARVLLQFKKYGMNMFHMVSEQAHSAFASGPEIRRLQAQIAGAGEAARPALQARLDALMAQRDQARRVVTGLLGMHQLLTGAMGLPFAGAGFAAADALRNWTGPNEDQHDTKADMANYLADALGTTASDAVMRGIPAALLNLDISKRVGMGDLMPFTRTAQDALAARASATGYRDMFNKELGSMVGPAGGIGADVAKGFDLFGKGRYLEGSIAMMPRALSRAAEGLQQMQEGVQVGGKSVTAPTGGIDALYGFLGLPSAHVAEAQDAAYSARDMTQRLQLTRENLIAAYADARRNGEPVPDEVQQFNQRNPDLQITAGDAYKKMQADLRNARVNAPARSAQQRAMQARTAARESFAQ